MEALLANPAVTAFIGVVISAIVDEVIRQSATSSNSLLQLLGRLLKGRKL